MEIVIPVLLSGLLGWVVSVSLLMGVVKLLGRAVDSRGRDGSPLGKVKSA